ncbi:MAG: serine/threonine protein kinase [Gammaproteobacteria bacterium]|nr:MAG: serine/threonine protein kinase [Gammaproteobacteria bacterium]
MDARLYTWAAPASLNATAPGPKAFESMSALFEDALGTTPVLTPPQETALRSPRWQPLAERALIGVAILWLVWGLKRVSLSTGLAVTLLSSLALIAIQVGALNMQALWLPLGVPVLYLLTGQLVMLFWLRPWHALQAERQAHHMLKLDHARLLMAQGKADDARDILYRCPPTPRVLELIYQLAGIQEQQRKYNAARELYQTLQRLRPGYKDVGDRLAGLEKARDALAEEASSLSLAATVAMQAPVKKPILGRYQLERELGRGAMGVVYLGTDPSIHRKVAIKTLSYAQFPPEQLDEIKDRFFREAKAAGRLSHPNIVTVFDMGEEPELAWMAMDYVKGKTLDYYCRPDRLLPVATVYQLMLKVAEALDYAHRQHIIHRDIKPGNLIYSDASGEVKIMDFGIARLTDDSRTRTSHVMGSPLYMSPEQLKGSKVTAASDIFSLGATFYQLLTGSTPFKADTLPELTLQIMTRKHRSVRDLRKDLPASAVRITNKALQKDPEKRYASAGEMAEQLRKALRSDLRTEVAG